MHTCKYIRICLRGTLLALTGLTTAWHLQRQRLQEGCAVHSRAPQGTMCCVMQSCLLLLTWCSSCGLLLNAPYSRCLPKGVGTFEVQLQRRTPSGRLPQGEAMGLAEASTRCRSCLLSPAVAPSVLTGMTRARAMHHQFTTEPVTGSHGVRMLLGRAGCVCGRGPADC